jgi:hypothetical protein
MAKIRKPTTAKDRKGPPPPFNEPVKTADRNLNKTPPNQLVNLSFKVSADFQKDFKQLALDESLKLVDLLKAAFENYKRR